MSSTAAQVPPLMSEEDRARHLEAIKFVESVFRLEGFEPTECMNAIDRAVLAGVGDYEDAVQEMIAYAKEHKSADGFVYSKAVGL
jgi:glycerol-3-phosphate cytidylyltransferase-like family protein